MKNTLVFGASLKPGRYSHSAIGLLRSKNIPTYAFGATAGKVSDVQVKTNLDELQDIHTVTLYMRKELQENYYQDILDLKPKRVIFNPGTENEEFYNMLIDKNIEAEYACTLTLLITGQY